jgi:hypothetical protein
MPINWIAALKLIPWSDVVQATPTVVQGAKDLWSRTKRSKAKAVSSDNPEHAEIGSLAHLTQRVEQLESEQLEASALINTLAEQNARLVAALDNLRTRMKMLYAVCVLLVLSGAALWFR